MAEQQTHSPSSASSSSSAARRAAWTALAAVAHVVLMSAAFETFRSRSPVRWWVLGVVVAYLAALLAAWRFAQSVWKRVTSAGLATAGGGLFLGMLAVTAWLPGGTANGIQLFGQSTSTLLAAVSAVAVAVAGLSLARARILPGWALYSLGAVAAYGALSFALGIKDATPYASLFQGGAFWMHLPRWLQGAFVGALGLVPVAILAQMIRAIDHLRRQQPARFLIHEETALVMALVMATSGLVRPGGVSMTMTTTRSSVPLGPDPIVSIEQWRKDTFGGEDPLKVWEKYSQVAEQELRKPGADPSDVKAKAAVLGHDAQKIFEFMRDQIMLEPYDGVLRGARGTLAAGAGNALDRALLAQDLLKAEGIESRLVAGKLSDAQAERLLARFLATSPIPKSLASFLSEPEDSSLSAEASDLSAKVGLPENRVSDLLQHTRVKAQEFWVEADGERAAQYGFLTDQLRRGGVKIAIDPVSLSAKLKGRLREHYWLQVREADGTWSEFDPTLPDARRGAVYGFDPGVLTEVPKDSFHRFEFKLVYRTVANGTPKEEVVVTGTFASSDALFAPLEFQIQPADATTEVNSLLAMDGKQKIAVLRQMKRFRGILRAGSRITAGRTFDLEGSMLDDSGGQPKSPAGALVGDFFGGGEEATAQFVELQVVLRLTGPGREPMTQTRTLVRAADLKAPTFAPPLLEWQMLLQPQWISADFAGFQMLSHVVGLGNAATEASRAGRRSAPFQPLPPVPLQLLQLGLLRQSAVAGILAKQDGVRALIDEPMLTISGHRLSGLHDQDGRITAQRSIDIVENPVRYVAKDERSQFAAFDAAPQQGVADSTLEGGFLREAYPNMIAQSGTTIIRRAQLEQRPPLLATSQEVERLAGAGIGGADVEWIRANESPAARLVIATTSNGSNAWWSVRPDGNAVLRTSGGGGQADIEVELVTTKVVFALICAFEFHEVSEAYESGRDMTDEEYYNLAFCIGATLASGGLVIAGLLFHGLEYLSLALIGMEFLNFNRHSHAG